jgi:hypothetical protein
MFEPLRVPRVIDAFLLFLTLFGLIALCGCTTTRLERDLCASPFNEVAAQKILDPRGILLPMKPRHHGLHYAVLRYLAGEICNEPSCDLFSHATRMACEEHLLPVSRAYKQLLVIEKVVIDQSTGDAIVLLRSGKDGRTYSFALRKRDSGTWEVFQMLWQHGVGVP